MNTKTRWNCGTCGCHGAQDHHLAGRHEKAKPLRVVDWTGPPRGPYAVLGFNHVPSNIMPLPPVAIWQDLHDLANASST